MTPERYRELKGAVIDAGYARDIVWAMQIEPPRGPLGLFREYAFVVVNSGMKAQIARRIFDTIIDNLENHGTAAAVYGHKAKAAAIQAAWDNMGEFYHGYIAADDKLAWCRSLPWIGPITCYHLAKNLGVDCAKPDRHLLRIATAAGETVDGLCRRLAEATGDTVAVVDTVVWRAANLGMV